MDGSSSASSSQTLPQVLVINPKNSLLFKGPSTQATTVQITLTNPANKWVAFKVKTTAPRRYCVRPNGGFIKGGDTMPVNIVYQPGDNNDPQDRARHKFLVQAIFVENDQVNSDQVWREASKDRLMESKIRCVFEDMEPGDSHDKQPAPQGTVHVGAGASLSMDSELINSDSVSTRTARVSESSGIGSAELELRRLAEDYRRAQDEIANLRDESRRLREDNVRIRKSLASIGQSSSGGSTDSSLSHTKEQPKDLTTLLKTDLPKVHILLTLFVAILVGAILSRVIF